MENEVQKHLINYYKHLKLRLNNWKSDSKVFIPLIQALSNQMEQLILSEKFDIENSEFSDFPDLKLKVIAKINQGIDDEFNQLSRLMPNISLEHKTFHDVSVKFESSTVNLDWDLDSSSLLIRGSALQRPLGEILKWVYTILMYDQKRTEHIKATYKAIDIRDLESVETFRKSFGIDAEIEHLAQLAINYMQYCDQVVFDE